MKDNVSMIESPLIGSGSQEEVDSRVQAIKDRGTSRGYLTYEELNERLPDEVVSPDKLDTLLMMIDEMGIRLIDEHDVADFNRKGKKPRRRCLSCFPPRWLAMWPIPWSSPKRSSPRKRPPPVKKTTAR